jgi:hypothetical protein
MCEVNERKHRCRINSFVRVQGGEAHDMFFISKSKWLHSGKGAGSCKGEGERAAVDRVIARRRKRRLRGVEADAQPDQTRLAGLGSVILNRLREVSEGEALDNFRVFAGLNDVGKLLLHRGVLVTDPGTRYSLYLCEDGGLLYESTTSGSEHAGVKRISLGSPEDFLEIDSEALEAIYGEVIGDDYWGRLAEKHARWGKPGYEDVWRGYGSNAGESGP